jgi:lipoate-protein ligase B
MDNPRKCTVLQPGRLAYGPAYQLQRQLIEIVRKDRARAFLILVEHAPVLTIGRRGTDRSIRVPRATLKREGIEVFEVDRGGDVTYHGPGQIVGYPILALDGKRRDVHQYLRSLEALLIRTVARLGVRAERRKGFTGVWVGQRKLASIGVGFTSWICFHGFALNVDPNMRHFELIHPCGLPGVQMTSLAELTGRRVSLAEVNERLLPEFAAEFEFDQIDHGEPEQFRS